ncbi:hypothetical protein KFL_003010140 [Klebsormidium nitens]|uniref:Replication origin-binding protein domain-containing protein n=1 Tax=Klebsormidium nitens TaxID=105231 RepID=A0A1Y1IEV3_KLENI|nr:hypothetical protein KFL_003010140 [Klebsormidium nitens]|eukprot:GAQ86638.1 hypothetical protein KFL_003010140 [Klebsormidium nitens]
MGSTATPSDGREEAEIPGGEGESSMATDDLQRAGQSKVALGDRRPAQKKQRKRARPAPLPLDEAARAAARAAVEAHRQALEALRYPTTQRDGQAVHQTELGDFGGPLDAAPVTLVTDAPITNVGALVDRVQATRDAEKAAAREERLKRYKRTRPLGVPPQAAESLPRSIEDPGLLTPDAPPSRNTSPALSREQPPSAPPLEFLGAEEEQLPAAPAVPAAPPVDQPPSPPFVEEVVTAPKDQPPEPLVTVLPQIGEALPEVVPGQPPTVAPPTQQQAPDPPHQLPAADASQPSAAEQEREQPTGQSPSALGPPEPLVAASEEPSPVVEAAAAEQGPGWCKKLQAALRQQRAAGHAVLVAEDVNDVGAKRWGSFQDAAALVAHRRSLGPYAHLYEVIQDDACWRIYFDLDFSAPAEDPGDFERRLQAFHSVRDRFLTSVLNLLEHALRFQACEAHGEARPPKQGFKYSVHEVLTDFYLRGLDARRAFGRAFGSFLEKPPNDLKSSVELLRKDGGSAYMWDGGVYGRHRCFRLLGSSKFEDRFRPLVPSEGSSEAIADHMVCLYSEAELAGSIEISADLLGEWATAKPAPPTPPRVGAFRSQALTFDEASTSRGPGGDLSEHERAVLLACYQEDHAGAEITRLVQERPGDFFVHFQAPDPMCCIAGRRHTSPGNQNPYLIYKRDEPRIARYQCFANSCRGECRVLPLDVLSTLGWTEDYVDDSGMRPYPVFRLQHVGKRTILARAKKGVGKSKELKAWEVAMIKKNPGLSLCSIGANISLSQKYRQDLVDAGVKDVVFYQEAPPGPINAPRVVCCINSIHRVQFKMDVLIIDEMDMVLANLNSEVMTQRGRVLSCLEALVAGARVVIGLDANIDSARVLEYLFMARPDADLHAIRNRGLYPASRHATIRVFPVGSGLRECIGTAVRDVLDRVARGTKVVCPSTCKRFVKQLEQDFNDREPARRVRSTSTWHLPPR